MKVVFDTNVLVSALNFPGGAPEVAYRLAVEGRLELVTTRTLLTELARVLTEKLGWDNPRCEEAVSQVVRLGRVVETAETIKEIAEDPSDDRVLEAAADGKVDAIVSGDRHLLRLRSWRDIRIVSPAALVAEFE